MRIVFFGTPAFAGHALEKIVEAGHEVAAVVTAPDKPGGRGHRLLESDVKLTARRLGLPVMQPVKLRDEAFLDNLRRLESDMFVVIAFRMLPKAVWAMPPRGTFNLHASLLPRYRGAAPINWAIINGETRTGVTTFFINEDIDTGPVIDSVEVNILADDNAGSLHDRLMELGAELTLKTLAAAEAGEVTQHEQSHAEATPAPKLTPDNMTIDWMSMSPSQIVNLVRGLAPYPGARATVEGLGQMKIMKAAAADGITVAPDQYLVDAKRLYIGCNGGAVELLELQPQGKRAMAARDFLNGLRF